MLSRVADNLYWMSRYLERAEHTARVLDLNLAQMLEQSPEARIRRWERVLAGLAAPRMETTDPYKIVERLTFDLNTPQSVAACIAQARENARQIREQISSEMYEQLNWLYLEARQTSMDQLWNDGPHRFFRMVKDGSHQFQGITDSTISHGEGWRYIQIGRFIERATSTANLVDVQFSALQTAQQGGNAIDEQYLDWVGLLKSCTAFEAYCRVYTADIQPEHVAEFLLLNPEFPQSVCFAAEVIQESLQAIARGTGQRYAGRAERLAGRLRAALDYGQVDEILSDDMHEYLSSIQRQCGQIHEAIYQTYITYPADAALAS